MDYPKNKSRVTAIVPIFNEANRIGSVLKVLSSYPGFAEIMVINDGSTDDSEKVVKDFSKVRYHLLPKNQGKAKAMDIGVNLSQTDIVFFCDGDIKGMTHEMLDEIIRPVVKGRVDMFIAMRNRKIYFLHKLVSLVPLLGGERALTKELWQKVPAEYKQKFRIEAGLNFYAKYYGKGFDIKLFQGLSQTIKEKKYGFWSGLKRRLAMFWDVLYAIISLQFVELPRDVTIFRRLLVFSLVSFLLATLGLTLLVALQAGQLDFVLSIFSEELKEDPNAPFVYFLLNILATTSRQTLYIMAYVMIVANLFAVITSISRLIINFRDNNYHISRYFSKIKK